eukprot:gnl/TRDRNA2_/TRDRNA2_83042_c0_seq1.p1 gnl/TRDRNA2_/TRDRNA2_83042_c0~~gnl/TRDRNA2_/TRDRNA2_83042_c0_seq1.p1  ORF type:complete len:222 (+),score=28.40 gnl/TRDRNA2_/TRDRNA2_83042_c0_seq1:46-666(+)
MAYHQALLDGDSSTPTTIGRSFKVPCLVLLSVVAVLGGFTVVMQSSSGDGSTNLIGFAMPAIQNRLAMKPTAARMGAMLRKSIRNPSQYDQHFDPTSMEQRLAMPRLVIMATATLGKKIGEEDMNSVPGDVSTLEVGDVAAIKRSDGSWRYAKVSKKMEGELDFDVDGAGSIKQFPQDTWGDIKVLGGPPGASGLGEDAVKGFTGK